MKKIICILSAFLILAVTVPFGTVFASRDVITETVSLLKTPQNDGDLEKFGWYWNNLDLVLTIKDLNIKTESDYGLKVQDGATVVILGDNVIEAEKAALYFGGVFVTNGITVKGNGTLTLKSKNGTGILCAGSNRDCSVRFTDTDVSIDCGGTGIESKNTSVTFSGGSLSVSSEKNAVSSKEFTVNGGCRFTSNAPIVSDKLTISAASVSVASGSSALVSDDLSITRVKLTAGDKLSSLSSKEEYGGENAIKTEVDFFTSTDSLIFGEKFTIVADIISLSALAVIILAVIIIPTVLKKKKAKRIIAVKEAEARAREAEIKAKKGKK